MKTLNRIFKRSVLLALLVFTFSGIFSQQSYDPSVSIPNYDADKLLLVKQQESSKAGLKQSNERRAKSQLCNPNFVNVDLTHYVLDRNDDGSSDIIVLPFTFNLYGSDYNSLYINTNGNVTFNNHLETFSSEGFPISTPMIAPFWADVDTREGGLIYYKILDNAIIITWDQVGYYDYQTDKLNEFQMILSDGTYSEIGLGNNVRFNYEDMQWTTGGASSGEYGFGGIPATVGINKGDGINYAQIGRFNVNDDSYDGPGTEYDGINYLDCKTFDFFVGSIENLPPVSVGFPSNNFISLQVGETFSFSPSFIGPEVFQNVSTVIETNEVCGVDYSISNGITSDIEITINALKCNVGTHTIIFTATDNGTPAATTSVEFTFEVIDVVNECNIIITEEVKNVTCRGDSDGAIDITVENAQEPISYTWSNGATTEDIDSLTSPVTYTVYIEDALGCQAQKSIYVGRPDLICIEETVTNANCYGSSDASVSISTLFGVAPLSFVWSNGETSRDISNVMAGTYSLTVVDADGCSVEKEIIVTEPVAIDVSAIVNQASCGAVNGSIELFVQGGTEPYNYMWNNGSTDSIIYNLSPGEYSVVITDFLGCSVQDSFNIIQNQGLTLTSVVNNGSCVGNTIASIDITVEGGTQPYTYEWSNGATTEDISGLAAGTYSVIVSDINGCTITQNFEILNSESIYLDLYSPIVVGNYNTSCNTIGDGSISLLIQGGTAPYTIEWSNGSDADFIENLVAGTYSVTVYDANNCSAEATITLTRPENCNCNPEIPAPSESCDNCETIIDDTNWANISYTTACIQNSYNSGVNMNNATLVICGTANISSLNMNGANKIVVLGTLNMPHINMNRTDIVIENYGQINIANWSGIGGTIFNYGNMQFGQGLNINTNASIYNAGNIIVTGSFDNNGLFVNDGYMSAASESHINSMSSTINNCEIEFESVIINSSLSFENNGTFTAQTTRFNTSVASFGSGSIIFTDNLYLNETVMSNNSAESCNLLSVGNRTEINGGSLIGTITLCDENGIERNNNLALTNGASLDCGTCSYNYTKSYTISEEENIEEDIFSENKVAEVKIFPIPAKSNDYISIVLNSDSFDVIVSNTIGLIVFEAYNNSKEVRISANRLSKGINFIKIIDNDNNSNIERTIIVE